MLSACVTNPITEDNITVRSKPEPGWSFASSLIPGLTQFINGEYIEALIYAGTYLGPALYIGTLLKEDPNNPDESYIPPEDQQAYTIALSVAMISVFWSYLDGVYSSYEYAHQWQIIDAKIKAQQRKQELETIEKAQKAFETKLNKAINTSEVVYLIKGTARTVDVTLSNATGGTEQHFDIWLPFFLGYERFPGEFLYISAQNKGAQGTVTVEIFYKGHLYKQSTSSGSYAIATASGSKPE